VSRFVLDASVAVAWVADRNPDPYAQTVLRKVREGARPVIPALWQLEVANALALVLRRQNLTADESEEGAAYLQRFATTIAEIDGHFLGIREAFVLSRELGLTAYDCVLFRIGKTRVLAAGDSEQSLTRSREQKGNSGSVVASG
jgi:predicted nucleic acid-binding protein